MGQNSTMLSSGPHAFQAQPSCFQLPFKMRRVWKLTGILVTLINPFFDICLPNCCCVDQNYQHFSFVAPSGSIISKGTTDLPLRQTRRNVQQLLATDDWCTISQFGWENCRPHPCHSHIQLRFFALPPTKLSVVVLSHALRGTRSRWSWIIRETQGVVVALFVHVFVWVKISEAHASSWLCGLTGAWSPLSVNSKCDTDCCPWQNDFFGEMCLVCPPNCVKTRQRFGNCNLSATESRFVFLFCWNIFKRVVARRAVYHTLNVITISLYVHPYV